MPIAQALAFVQTSIAKCEKIHPKFAPGTSQHTLLTNRIKALKIAQSLLTGDGSAAAYTPCELAAALPPIRSIRSKTANARRKHEPGSAWYARLTPGVEAMDVCEALIAEEINRRG